MRYILIALFTFTLFACQHNSENDTATTNQDLKQFENFYIKFHQDSIYQIEHITFPLEGLPEQADSAMLADNNFRWEKKNWRTHQMLNPNDSNFKQEFIPVGNAMIIEKITDSKTGFAMTRRFAKLDEEWYLIYYSGMNKLITG